MEGSEEEGACFYQQWKNFPIPSGLTKDNLGSTEQRRFTPLHCFCKSSVSRWKTFYFFLTGHVAKKSWKVLF